MRVLSLFNGISCGRVALERANISVEEYVSYEIDTYANQIAKKNYPNDTYLGDVVAADYLQYRGFDILMGGSPCQDLCSCGSGKGLDGEKSGLFFYYLKALETLKPKYFLLENSYSMTQENKDIISEYMGCEPVYINSGLVSAQDRKRLYWTNIPIVGLPQDKNLALKDIVEPTENKINVYDRMMAKKDGTLAYKKAWGSVRDLSRKSKAMTTTPHTISSSGSTNIKYSDIEYYVPTPIECERLQTLPDNYTEGISNTQRYKCIGNGWTVDVISWILSFIPKEVE